MERENQSGPSPPLKLGGGTIKYENSVKYLRVIHDEKLNFRAHIKEKITKARKALYTAINKVRGAIGPHPRSLKWVYEGVALPIVTYACHVWWTRADRAELQKFNRQGCLLVAPCTRQHPN